MGQEVVAGEAGGHVRGGDLQQLLHVHILKRDPEAVFLDDILTKSLKAPCYSQSPLLMDFIPPLPLRKSGLKLVCNVNIVPGILKSANSQDYARILITGDPSTLHSKGTLTACL